MNANEFEKAAIIAATKVIKQTAYYISRTNEVGEDCGKANFIAYHRAAIGGNIEKALMPIFQEFMDSNKD